MENKNKTKLLLLKESMNQFSKDGFEKASIRSICDKLNMSNASINYHFKNKECLISEVINYAISKFVGAIKESEKEFPCDLYHFLNSHAKKIYQFDHAVLLTFRGLFYNDEGKFPFDERITSTTELLTETSFRVATKDQSIALTNKEDFQLRLNMYVSTMILEVIKKSLVSFSIPEDRFENWVYLNLKVIFPQNK